MNQRFNEGQKVVCISEHFPLIDKYGGTGKQAVNTPKKGEVLVIDEILGCFLRFDKYDTQESFNWWKDDRFAPISEEKMFIEESILEEAYIILDNKIEHQRVSSAMKRRYKKVLPRPTTL